MKDRILIYQDYTMHNFGLAKTLQEKHDCDLFAIFDVTDNMNKFFQKQKIVNYDQSVPIIQGQWYTFGPINLDHYQSVGHMLPKGKRKFLDSIYINHAQLLWSLPEY